MTLWAKGEGPEDHEGRGCPRTVSTDGTIAWTDMGCRSPVGCTEHKELLRNYIRNYQ